jgi:ribonucleoside-triphosphate reductase
LIQDLIENELISSGFAQTAKAFILYRKERANVRQKVGFVPEKVKELVSESKKYFRNPLAEFVYYRTYAKWIDEEGRRETWIETVDRYMAFMKENINGKLTKDEYAEVREAILNQEAMPSMRLLQFAGPAARKTNICAYNCSFIAPKSFQDFAEIMYISMCGTGVGWSVESENIQALPQIQKQTGKMLPTYVVPDSKEGWADAFAFGLKTWFEGNDVVFDYSLIRPAGSRLKTMGGKSSGPEPLRSLLEFTRERVMKRQGRHLMNLDAHDIICKIGECVVAGGVRRSAMISLSDLDDEAIRDSKKGQFYLNEGQRMLANNSAVYNGKPTTPEFLDEWTALVKSGSGERGIFNRGGLAKTLPKRRLDQWKGGEFPAWGTNPCGEIILQSKQFCNLSEVVARAEDTEESLLRKVRIATILGTYQSSLAYFPYLSKEWKKNCEKERLLGVSITGQWDSALARDPKTLEKIRNYSIEVNKKYAKRFEINQSTCITCVKPSGTVSQTVDCASGMHPRHAPYYIRRVRISATDALFKMLKDQGVPYYPEVGQTLENATTFVLEFPIKAPEGAICKDDITALDQLEHWKIVKKHYTEHNPSVTISVGDDEWLAVANWIYVNWDLVGGLSFLPRSNHVYQLAPYETITKEKYEEMIRKVSDLDFSKIVTYEVEDETEVKKELACVSGVCEV